MNLAFVLFDGLTTLDFVGLYDPLTRLRTMGFLPDLRWELCGLSRRVRDDRGLSLEPTWIARPLDAFDALIVPGGFGTRRLVDDANFLDWLRSGAGCGLKASVCTGALLLGAAGFLEGRRATTHPNAYELLQPYCAEVSGERIVDEGEVVTARGVTSALDLGLHLVRRLGGEEAQGRIRTQMDYPYGE